MNDRTDTAIFYKSVKIVPRDKMTFEQRLEGEEGGAVWKSRERAF